MYKSESGFTLLELVAVIAIIGILTAFLAVNFTSTENYVNLESARKKMVADIAYAQDLTMSSGSSVQVIVNVSENKYSLKWVSGSYVPNIMGGGDYIVDFNSDNFSGVNIQGTDLTAGTLTFNSIGIPTTGGAEIQNILTVANLNGQSYVKVTPYTGRITIVNTTQ